MIPQQPTHHLGQFVGPANDVAQDTQCGGSRLRTTVQ